MLIQDVSLPYKQACKDNTDTDIRYTKAMSYIKNKN